VPRPASPPFSNALMSATEAPIGGLRSNRATCMARP
jgi:hypothetical protein